jgi:hypothetical protein
VYLWSWRSPFVVFNVIVAAFALVLLVRVVSVRQAGKTLPLLLLVGGAVLIHAGLICLTRSMTDAVGIFSHRLYLFALLLAPALYAAADATRLTRRVTHVAAGVLAGFVIVHAIGTWEVARQIGRDNARASSYVSEIADFVDAHRAEPGFTFALPSHPPDVDPAFDLLEGYPDDPAATLREVPVTDILFARYYDAVHPQYTFVGRGTAAR